MIVNTWVWFICSVLTCLVGVTLAVLDGVNIMVIAIVGASAMLSGIEGAALYWLYYIRKSR